MVYKRRIALQEWEASSYMAGWRALPQDSQIGREIAYFRSFYQPLRPMVYLCYDRCAYFSTEDAQLRATFDANIRWRTEDVSLTAPPAGSRCCSPGSLCLKSRPRRPSPFGWWSCWTRGRSGRRPSPNTERPTKPCAVRHRRKGRLIAVLESLFSAYYNSGTDTLTVPVFLILMAAALGLGALFALCYQKGNRCSRSFAVTLATLPAVVSVVILMVSGSIGAGVAVAGTFSLVRFRSAPGTGKEIAAVFTAMAIGLACGMGCPGLAVLFTAIMCAVDLFYNRIRFGESRDMETRKALQVTVPENLDYTGIFDDLFAEYTREARLVRVKTTNLGSLNRLSYEIDLKTPGTEKQLIDQLRCRNGNLEISLSAMGAETDGL